MASLAFIGTGVMGRRYRVEGTFTRLPDIVERPICATCVVPTVTVTRPPARARKPTSLPTEVDVAIALGLRLDRYLALPAREQASRWAELHRGLVEWSEAHGNPNPHRAPKRSKHPGAQRFLAAFQSGGGVLDSLSTPPEVSPEFKGR